MSIREDDDSNVKLPIKWTIKHTKINVTTIISIL